MKRLKNIRRAAGCLPAAVLSAMAVYALAGAWQEKQDGEPFFFFGMKPVLVLSDSMEPTMKERSIALVRKQTGQPELGDIVMFQTDVLGGRLLVTHRIVGEEAGKYVTKGDNNELRDRELLDMDRLKGEVIFILNPP